MPCIVSIVAGAGASVLGSSDEASGPLYVQPCGVRSAGLGGAMCSYLGGPVALAADLRFNLGTKPFERMATRPSDRCRTFRSRFGFWLDVSFAAFGEDGPDGTLMSLLTEDCLKTKPAADVVILSF